MTLQHFSSPAVKAAKTTRKMLGGELASFTLDESDTARSTSSSYPYCRKYTTGIFSAFECDSIPGVVDVVLATPTSRVSETDLTGRTSSLTSGPTTSTKPAISFRTSEFNDPTPLSETQQTGSDIPTSSVTPSAAAMRLLNTAYPVSLYLVGVAAWMMFR